MKPTRKLIIFMGFTLGLHYFTITVMWLKKSVTLRLYSIRNFKKSLSFVKNRVLTIKVWRNSYLILNENLVNEMKVQNIFYILNFSRINFQENRIWRLKWKLIDFKVLKNVKYLSNFQFFIRNTNTHFFANLNIIFHF